MELVTLIPNDGSELAITDPLVLVSADWGDADTQANLAEGPDVVGAVVGTRQRLTREIALEIGVNERTGTDFTATASGLDAAIAELQAEGGYIRRQQVFADGSSEVHDVEVLEAHPDHLLGEVRQQGWDSVAVTFICQPEWLAAQELKDELAAVTGARIHEIILNGVDAVRGNLSGPGELEVIDLAGQRRRFAEIGYSSDITSQIEFMADDFELGDGATLQADTAAFAGQAIQLTPVVPSWQVVGYLRDLPHRGAWVPRTRSMFTANSDAEIQLRISYREGAGTWRELAVQTLRTSAPALYHETAFPGLNRRGSAETMDVRVEVYSATPDAVNAFRFNGLTLFPADDIYAIARGVKILRKAAGMTEFDDLPAEGGSVANLAGRVAPLGGTWAAQGDTTPQFQFFPAGGYASRDMAGVADASMDLGGYAQLATTNYTNCTVTGAFSVKVPTVRLTEHEVGVYLGWVDASNNVRATLRSRRLNNGKHKHWVRVRKLIAGTPTDLALVEIRDTPAKRNGGRIEGVVSLTRSEDGKWRCEVGPLAGNALDATEVVASGQDNALATGGTLASGRTGGYHASTATDGSGRMLAFATQDEAQAEQLTDVVRADGFFTGNHREAYASGGPNLLINPDFEANTVGWIADGSPSVVISRTTSQAHSGAASLQVDLPAGSSLGVLANDFISVPTAGHEYVYSAWVLAPVGLNMVLRVSPSPNPDIDEPFVGTGDWQFVSMTFTLPSEAQFGIYAMTGSTTFYVDDGRLALTELIQPIPVYQGSRLWLPPGPGRLVVKLRAGDSDAEDDRLTDHGDDPIETVQLSHHPAFAGLSDELA